MTITKYTCAGNGNHIHTENMASNGADLRQLQMSLLDKQQMQGSFHNSTTCKKSYVKLYMSNYKPTSVYKLTTKLQTTSTIQ